MTNLYEAPGQIAGAGGSGGGLGGDGGFGGLGGGGGDDGGDGGDGGWLAFGARRWSSTIRSSYHGRSQLAVSRIAIGVARRPTDTDALASA